MDYAEVQAAFFQPRAGEAEDRTSDWQSPARALRDAIEPIAMICYWSEPAYDALAALGLDFLQGYVWGRASSLGEPDGAVVAAAFGVFEPGLVTGTYDAGRTTSSLAQIRAAREAGAVNALEQVLGSPDGLADAVTQLRRGAKAADPTGRPLYAGLRALPWPDRPLGKLWHAGTLLRELRGDGHMAACVSAGLTGLEANIVTELRVGWEPRSYTATRGWSPERMQAATSALTSRGLVADEVLTPDGIALRDDIEQTTDRLMHPVVDAIGDTLPDLVERLDGWSQQIIDAGWFPPDPYKRASG